MEEPVDHLSKASNQKNNTFMSDPIRSKDDNSRNIIQPSPAQPTVQFALHGPPSFL